MPEGFIMFICSVRASTVRFFAVIALTVAVTVALLIAGGERSVFTSVSVGGRTEFRGGSEEERQKFLSSFGVLTDAEPKESVTFTVPEDFDLVLSGYNEIQKAQGLDIGKYKKKKVTRYTYLVKNAKDEAGETYADIIVWRGYIIAADITPADPAGEVLPMTEFAARLAK